MSILKELRTVVVLGIVLYSGITYGQAPNASAIEIGKFSKLV